MAACSTPGNLSCNGGAQVTDKNGVIVCKEDTIYQQINDNFDGVSNEALERKAKLLRKENAAE
jgi:hypothetical protein